MSGSISEVYISEVPSSVLGPMLGSSGRLVNKVKDGQVINKERRRGVVG